MADNLQLNAGADGAKLVTAEFTWSGDTAQLQGIFGGILSGSEGSWSFTQLVGGAGAVTAGTQRMTLASDDPAVALLTTIDADTSNLAAATADITGATPSRVMVIGGDDGMGTIEQFYTDGSGNLKVNLAAGVAFNAGAASATTQRTVSASDDPAVVLLGTIDADTGAIATSVASIDGKITACNTGAVVISSGTITTVTTVTTVSAVTAITNALPAGDNNIGNVDVVTLPIDFNAGVVGATTPRVTLASDDPAVALLGTIDTDTGNIATAASSIDGKITACNTGAIAGTVTANAGTNLNTSALALEAGGNLAAAVTALQIIDDWDDGSDHCEVVGAAAEDAAAAGAPVLVGGRYDSTARTLDNGDAGALALSAAGEVIAIAQAKYVQYGDERCEVKHFGTVTSTDDTSLIAAVAGKRFLILSLYIVAKAATATNIALETKTTNTGCFWTTTDPQPLAADADGDNVAGDILPWNPGGWFKTADTNEDLALRLSAAQKVGVYGSYIEFTP